MRMTKRPRYKTVLALFCLLICVVPLTTISLFSYRKFADLVTDYLRESNAQMLNQLVLHVDESLRISDSSMVQFIIDPDLKKLLNTPYGGKQFKEFEILYKRLYLMQTYNMVPSDICIVNYTRDWMLGNNYIEIISQNQELQNYLDQLKEYTGEREWVVYPSYKRTEGRHYNLYSVLLFRSLHSVTYDDNCFLMINFPLSEIKRLVKIPQNSQLVILDSRGRGVYHEDEEKINQDLTGEPFVRQFREGEEPFQSFPWNGEQSLVIHQVSDYNKWEYFLAIPTAQIYQQIWAIVGTILLFFFFILLVSVFFAAWFSKRLYSPVEKLITLTMPEGPPILSPHSEFDFISEQVRQIKAKNLQFRQELTARERLVQQTLLHSLLNHTVAPQDSAHLGIPEDLRVFCLLDILADWVDERVFGPNDHELMHFGISNICQEVFKSAVFYSETLEEEHCYVLLGSRDDSPAFQVSVRSSAESLCSLVETLLKVHLCIAVSGNFSNLSQTVSAKEECKKLMDQRMVRSSGIISLRLPVNEKANLTQTESLKQMLLLSIREQDISLVEQYLGSYLEILCKDHNDTFQMQLIELLVMVEKVMRELDGFDCTGKLHPNELLRLKTVYSIHEWFRVNLLEPYRQCLEAGGQEVKNKTIKSCIAYIYQNLENNISLESCASQLGYSFGYVSRLFKKETGIGFGEYLILQRIEYAKSLLDETELTVAEIAQKIQYNNSQNFIRVFKKNVGMTPGQYRNRQTEENF